MHRDVTFLARRGERLLSTPSEDPTGQAITKDAEVLVLAGQRYVQQVSEAIASASQRVWIATFGLRATTASRLSRLVSAIEGAARRGVDVQILTDPDPRWRGVAAVDGERFAQLGATVRAWPVRSRLHARAVIVDEVAFVGSVGWTPASIFLTEECAVGLRGGTAIHAIASRFEHWWALATTNVSDWPIEWLGWPPALIARLRSASAVTLGDLAGGRVIGNFPSVRRAAALVLLFRLPPRLALAMSAPNQPLATDRGLLLGVGPRGVR